MLTAGLTGQVIFWLDACCVVAHDSYAYLVPSAEGEAHFFLKTITPCRKASRDCLTVGDADAEH